MRRELTAAGLINFEEGAIESLNPELGVQEQADMLPYYKKWEFPRDKLKLGKVHLGLLFNTPLKLLVGQFVVSNHSSQNECFFILIAF